MFVSFKGGIDCLYRGPQGRGPPHEPPCGGMLKSRDRNPVKDQKQLLYFVKPAFVPLMDTLTLGGLKMWIGLPGCWWQALPSHLLGSFPSDYSDSQIEVYQSDQRMGSPHFQFQLGFGFGELLLLWSGVEVSDCVYGSQWRESSEDHPRIGTQRSAKLIASIHHTVRYSQRKPPAVEIHDKQTNFQFNMITHSVQDCNVASVQSLDSSNYFKGLICYCPF